MIPIAKNRGLRFKIVVSVFVYTLLIGVSGIIFLYMYIHRVVLQKTTEMYQSYLEAVRVQIDRNLEEALSLGVLCVNNPTVLYLVSRQEWEGTDVIRGSLAVQEKIDTLLQAHYLNYYVEKVILFDNRGLFVHASGRQGGEFSDIENIQRLPLMAALERENRSWVCDFDRSIALENRRGVCMFLLRVPGFFRNRQDGYLYMEFGLDMITDVFREFDVPPGVFAQAVETGKVLYPNEPRMTMPRDDGFGQVPVNVEYPYRFRRNGKHYRLDRFPMENGPLVLYNQADVSSLTRDDRELLNIVLAAILLAPAASAVLGLFLSLSITRPIQPLIRRIRKISEENDFSPDPEIEKRNDEIGLIGRAVNEMSGNIKQFLKEMEDNYRQRKNAEIVLLQTQINPHFIYNTLGSIQWMARIQSNTVIADITRHFINLLRSIVSRTNSGDDTIRLAEELRILDDYTKLMTLRYMGTFELVNQIPESFLNCRIPKLTLQPLVENAILHGIEPSGRYGVITLNADECIGENGRRYLLITVEDTGTGMSGQQLETIKTRSRAKEKGSPSLNNIGIVNVDERLKLLYDETCGLFFESVPGKFTKVQVKIPMNNEQDNM